MTDHRPRHPVVAGSLATMFEMLFAYPLEYVKVLPPSLFSHAGSKRVKLEEMPNLYVVTDTNAAFSA